MGAFNGEEPSSHAFWSEVLHKIDGDANVLTEQLGAAREPYPELASAFGLLLSYVRFLHRTILGLTPVPPVPLPIPYDFPARLCEKDRLFCQCAHGDRSACQALGGEYAEGPLTPGPTCEYLWEQYRTAVQQSREALARASPGGRYLYLEESELRKSDPAVRSAWLALIASGCVELPVELGTLPSG